MFERFVLFLVPVELRLEVLGVVEETLGLLRVDGHVDLLLHDLLAVVEVLELDLFLG